MFGKMRRFLREDDGAVTVDWVVLTAGIVVFASATILMVRNVTTDSATGIGARIDQHTEDLLPD